MDETCGISCINRNDYYIFSFDKPIQGHLMVGSIYTYALIKALYDEGQDYLDSFWPFVVEAIPSNKSVTPRFIQKKLKEM